MHRWIKSKIWDINSGQATGAADPNDRVTTHLENLVKAVNLILVREKSREIRKKSGKSQEIVV